MKSLDDVRAKFPHLSLALYAFDPGKPVTLECITTDGKTFKFTGRTEAEAISKAFDEDDTPSAPTNHTSSPEHLPLTPTPATSVFD